MNIPTYCRLVVDPNDQCCKVPVCVTPAPTPTPGPKTNPTPTMTVVGVPGSTSGTNPPPTPQPKDVCVYNGKMYTQGQKWQDGCKCKSYNNLGSGCVMVSDPKDQCCQIPQCTYVPTPGPTVPGSPPPTFCPYPMPTAVPGVISGGPQTNPNTGVAPSNVGQCPRYVGLPTYCKMADDPNNKCCKKPACNVCPQTTTPPTGTGPTPSAQPTPAPKEGCVMSGNTYTQGQKWYSGCDQICVCDDGKTGVYTCNQRCPTYQNNAGCTMVPDPRDPACCLTPKCPTDTGVFGTINGSGTPMPLLPGTNPPITGSGTPAPSPAPVCVYKGKSYAQGQRWQDGCQYECLCYDAPSGKYSCTDRCPRFPDLPPNCHLVYDPVDPCCQKKECLTVTPTPFPGMVTPAPTPAPSSNFCVYQGIPYRQDQTFNKGCDQVCKCEDAMTGKITCNDRCPSYPALTPNCTLTTDPNDQCCQIPVCTGPNGSVVGLPGTISGSNVPTTNNNPYTSGTKSGCVYNGQVYGQSQTWDDGCKFSCECLDATTGQYKCSEKCPRTPPLPSYCSLTQDPNNKCCQVPFCTPKTQTNPPPIGSTLTPTPPQPSKCAKYSSIQPGCTLVPDPKDPTCCEIPSCPIVPQGPSPTPGIITLAPQPPGVITGGNPTPLPGSTLPPPCQKYGALPSECVLVQDVNKPCCQVPYCDFTNPTPFPTGMPVPQPIFPTSPPGVSTVAPYLVPGLPNTPPSYVNPSSTNMPPSPTPQPQGICPTYPPSSCPMKSDPNDRCCLMPDCNNAIPTPMTTPPPGQTTMVPTFTLKPVTGGTITGNNGGNPVYVPPMPGQSTSGSTRSCPKYPELPPSCELRQSATDVCCKEPLCHNYIQPTTPAPQTVAPVTDKPIDKCKYFDGTLYSQGAKWQDGCSTECVCNNAALNQFNCDEKCPVYSGLPKICTLITDPAKPCCKKPLCTLVSGSTLSPIYGNATPPPKSLEVLPIGTHTVNSGYGKPATSPGMTGQRPCGITRDKDVQKKVMCPTYNNLPSNQCYLVKADGQCCSQPMCYDPNTSKVVNPLNSQSVFPVVGTYSGGFTGFRPNTSPGGNVGGSNTACVYKGHIYHQGDTWDDACDFTCACIDEKSGTYKCSAKCPTYTNIPPVCRLVDQSGSCCKRLTCNNDPNITLPPGTTILPPATTPKVDLKCRDRIDNCRSYGRVSCTNYPDWASRATSAGPVITTPAVQTSCKDSLATCNLLDKEFYCKGEYFSWALTNCKSYCGYCDYTTTVATVPTTTHVTYPYELLLKGVAGAPGPDLYQLWHSGQTLNGGEPLASHLTSEYNGHYKPDTSNHWNNYCFDQIRVSIFNNGIEKAYILFNSTGSTKENWFTSDRIIDSSWTDLKTAQKEIMSLSGDANTGREFYISGHTSQQNKCDSFGWMMVSTKPSCYFEAGDAKPTFYYAPGTGQANWAISRQSWNWRCLCNSRKTNLYVWEELYLASQQTMLTKPLSRPNALVMCRNGLWSFKRCPKYTNLPPGCTVEKQPGDCCGQPTCAIGQVSTIAPIVIVGGTCAHCTQKYLLGVSKQKG
ncbi:SAS-like protein [Mya arenaria]|uniref:SAS-like protein n=1 Tax=Mya arenaria TaxID=6604 RepID=A0ABY7EPS5_MYAAR|nr:SAS-like protein [Mya arenaria]